MFRKLIVPLDGSSLAEQALGTASAIARACNAEVELLLVHNGASFNGIAHGSTAGAPEEHIYVQGIAQEVASRFSIAVTTHVAPGIPVEAIVRRVRETAADLIVMTSHGRTGFSRAWLGSVADGVVRESTIPVLIERPVEGRKWRTSGIPPFHRVLIPLDGSPMSAAVLRPAIDLCRWLEARPILARVVLPATIDLTDAGVPLYPPAIVDEEGTRHYVNQAQDQLTELSLALEADTRILAETEVAVGNNVAATIIDVARRRRADLIAMSTHSRGPSRLLLGSVTDKVLRGTQLPILVLHPSPTAVVPEDRMARAAGTG
ncbi:MAG TPA: universal stress protein [Gemmatimonadaceae bacterium]|nr:universal stress protein [Gemmatimonadaceae bacterium]